MKMIIHQGKPSALEGEDTHQRFEPVFDPLFAVPASVAAQERAANALRDAMIPRYDGRGDEF
jgi:hypothetical protein